MTINLPRTPSFRLDGRKALVTGATSGIGLGCAVALAEAGAHVTIAARNEVTVMNTVASFLSHGWHADGLSLDVADTETVEMVVGDLGPFDILINSAGLARNVGAFDVTEDDFDSVVNLNLKGAYYLTRAVAKGLIASGKPGSLINISSQMGHIGGIDRTVYCGTKHAVEGFTKAMAIEFGPHNIRVNTICPTFIKTPLTEPTFNNPERVAWIMDKIKLPRVGEIEDIMGAALFLASDASAMVTGTGLLVDGGWTAG